MPADPNREPGAATSHLVYDEKTGRIVGRFRRYDHPRKEYASCDAEEILELFRDDEQTLAQPVDGAPEHLAVLATELPLGTRLADFQVAKKRRALVERPRLRLRTDRTVLTGDGQDTVTLEVEAIDRRGRVNPKLQTELVVTTTRGKLSRPGGRMALDQGRGSLELTSVRETVERVRVRVEAADGSAAPDALELRFE